MDVLEAYDLTGTARRRQLTGVDHHRGPLRGRPGLGRPSRRWSRATQGERDFADKVARPG